MSHRFVIQKFVAVLFAIIALNQVASAQSFAGRRVGAEVRRLSPTALEPLVAGIALYPDPLVKDILNAATTPQALQEAAGTSGLSDSSRARSPESVRALQVYPKLLNQLQQHWLLTVRLGIAYRQQPADVWSAIEHVRTSVDSLVPPPSAGSESSDPPPTTVYANSVGVVMNRLLSPAAVAELQASVASGSAPRTADTSISSDVAESRDSQSPAPTSAQPSSAGARYSQLNQEQIALANHAISQSWSRLESQLAAKRPNVQTPDRSRLAPSASR